jgi:hypothetical protein
LIFLVVRQHVYVVANRKAQLLDIFSKTQINDCHFPPESGMTCPFKPVQVLNFTLN